MNLKFSHHQLLAIGILCGAFFAATSHAQSIDGKPQVLDDFDAIRGWVATPSDGVSLHIRSDSGHVGGAMRLDFDFQGHGGYAVARKQVQLELPDNYAFTFWIRGEAPVNNLEFKLIDSTGDNVWWMNQRGLTFPRGWKKMTIRRRQIEFAWGPSAGCGASRRRDRAGDYRGYRGKGSIWIDQFQLEPRPTDHPYDLTPAVSASGSVGGHAPEMIVDADSLSVWRSEARASHAWVALDFKQNREFGGILIDWEPNLAASNYVVELSDDGLAWSSTYTARGANGGHDYIYLPETDARYLRVIMERGFGHGFGIRTLRVEPLEWAATRTAFLQSIADDAPRGHYPRYFTRRQSYWTIVGASGDGHRSLLGQDGAFESMAGGFSVEPFIRMDDRTLSWADASPRQSLAEGYLPIPSVEQTFGDVTLTVTAFAAGPRGSSSAYTRYRVANRGARPRHATLYLAVRPLQVNPPWQFLGVMGGAARIDSVRSRGNSVWINGSRRIDVAGGQFPFGAATLDQGDISEFLFRGDLPPHTIVRDPLGLASAAFSFPLNLAPRGVHDIYLRFPLGDSVRGGKARPWRRHERRWQRRRDNGRPLSVARP